jgi:hypothetical protein
VFLFVRTQAELKARMAPAVAALGPGAAIWVFFRKGAGAAGLDMNRDREPDCSARPTRVGQAF